MKEALINTVAGRIAMRIRDAAVLQWAALVNREAVGRLANDQLATTLITRLCQPGKIFIDVGAHIGSIVADVLHHDASIRIVAVEAIPEKVSRLRRNFPHVEVHECAAGESTGKATFFIHTKRSGYSSLGRPAPGEVGVREIRVSVQRLDDIVPLQNVDAVKIDVEGAELGVLRGAHEVLAASRPTVMFESAPERDDGLPYSREAMWRFLSDQDYCVVVPNRLAHNDDGLSSGGFVESHLHPRRTTNYVAVARERRTEIRDRARTILGI